MKTSQGEGAASDPLDAIAGEAARMQASAGAQVEGEGGEAGEAAAPAALTNAQCLAMGLQMVRETLCAVARVTSPKTHFDDNAIQTIADAVAPVLDKHGINLASVAGDYMVELRAVVVTVPIILAARVALVEEIRSKKATPVEVEPAPAAAP